jgi:NADH-ubiquinone oxidoreductase chain 4
LWNHYLLSIKFSFLFFFVISAFLVKDLIFFYICFELSLLPIINIVFSFGYQPERLEASIYFLMYALIGSFPLLLKIIYYNKIKRSLFLSYYFKLNSDIILYICPNKIIIFFWFFSFIIKLPIFGFHLWLPKAHVESPVTGSMVLAAIMLKLGAYGLFRLSIFNLINYFKILICWVIVTSFWVSIIAYRNVDIKSLIAYSSISHMSFLLILYMYSSKVTTFAVLFILIGHGFVRRGLFFLFNSLYSITSSRSIILKKSFGLKRRLFFFFFFIIIIFNSSFPLNLTFFSEIIVRLVIFCFNKMFLFFFVLSVLFIGLYNIKLFLVINHGYQLKNLHLRKNISLVKYFDSFFSLVHLILKIKVLLFFFLWVF